MNLPHDVPPSPGGQSADTAIELEQVLRHIIALAQRNAGGPDADELLGVGVQLVYAKAGVRFMSIKADLDPRNHELLCAGALVRASSASTPPDLRDVLIRIDQLIAQASDRCLRASTAGLLKN